MQLNLPPITSAIKAPKSESMNKTAAERLSEVKALFDAGLINEEMFVEKQKSILQNV